MDGVSRVTAGSLRLMTGSESYSRNALRMENRPPPRLVRRGGRIRLRVPVPFFRFLTQVFMLLLVGWSWLSLLRNGQRIGGQGFLSLKDFVLPSGPAIGGEDFFLDQTGQEEQRVRGRPCQRLGFGDGSIQHLIGNPATGFGGEIPFQAVFQQVRFQDFRTTGTNRFCLQASALVSTVQQVSWLSSIHIVSGHGTCSKRLVNYRRGSVTCSGTECWTPESGIPFKPRGPFGS